MSAEELKDFEHGPLQWPFLIFKALMFSEPYTKYANNLDNKVDKNLKSSLEADHPEMAKLYEFWGNVYSYFDSSKAEDTTDNMFERWRCANHPQLMVFYFDQISVVHGNKPITPKVSTIYFAIPEQYDTELYMNKFGSMMGSAFEMLDKEADKNLPIEMHRTKMWNDNKLAATERRLDAFIGKNVLGMSNLQCVTESALFERKCWETMTAEVQEISEELEVPIKEIPGKHLAKQKSEISELARQGKRVIENLLLGKFPSPG